MIFKKVLHSYNTAFQCESRDIVRALYTANNTEDKREKTQALSLAKECYSMKLDYLQMLLSWMMPLGLSLPGQIRNRNPQVTTMKMIKNQTNPITMKTEIS
jgi:hypothetical protein